MCNVPGSLSIMEQQNSLTLRSGCHERYVALVTLVGIVIATTAMHADASTTDPPPRVALVNSTDAGHKQLDQARALAEVTLAEAEDLRLVEREQIEATLAEHELSLSGWLDGQWAFEAGRLLPVDLFAVVLPPMGGLDAEDAVSAGLVVYDAATGVRLSDTRVSLEDVEAASARIVEVVQTAIAKHREMDASVRTLGLLQVRNVGLPTSEDSFVEAVGLLLERSLVGSPSVAVLERRQLDHVVRERALPTLEQAEATGEPRNRLLASMTTLSLSMERAPDGEAVLAEVVLHRGGEPMGKVRVESAERDALRVARKLADEMLAKLEAQPVDDPMEAGRAQEAALLIEEMRFRDAAGAYRAAAAAYALQPSDVHYAFLAQATMAYAAHLMMPEASDISSYYQIDVVEGPHSGFAYEGEAHEPIAATDPDSARQGLRLGERALRMHDDLGLIPFKNAGSTSFPSFARRVAVLREAPADVLEHVASLRPTILRRWVTWLEVWSEPLEEGGDPWESDYRYLQSYYHHDAEGYARQKHRLYPPYHGSGEQRRLREYLRVFTNGLVLRALPLLAEDEHEAAMVMTALTDRLLELLQADEPFAHGHFPRQLHHGLMAAFPALHVGRRDERGRAVKSATLSPDFDLVAYAERLEPTIDRLRDHPHPIVRLHHPMMELWLAVAKRNEGDSPPFDALEAVSQATQAALDDPESWPVEMVSKDIWYVWERAVALAFVRDEQREKRASYYHELVAQMAERRLVVLDALERLGRHQWGPPEADVTVAKRLREVVADPATVILSDGYDDDAAREQVAALMSERIAGLRSNHPELIEQAQVTPWTEKHRLLHVDPGDQVGVPLIVDYHLFVSVASLTYSEAQEQQSRNLKLLRIPLAGGEAELLGVLEGQGSPVMSMRHVVPVIVRDHLYQPVFSRGLAVFALNGSSAFWLNEDRGLPFARVGSVAAVGEKLYLAPGFRGRRMLVSYDTSDGTWHTIASAMSPEPRNPLDGHNLPRLHALAGDEARQRMIVSGHGRISGESSSRRGLWVLHTDTDEVEFLYRFVRMSESHRTRLPAPSELIPEPGATLLLPHSDGVARLDLETDEVTSLYPRRLNRPFAVVGDWLWQADPFGRTHLDTGERQLFRPLDGELSAHQQAGYAIIPTGDGRVVLAGSRGIWIVEIDE